MRISYYIRKGIVAICIMYRGDYIMYRREVLNCSFLLCGQFSGASRCGTSKGTSLTFFVYYGDCDNYTHFQADFEDL